MKTNYTPLQNLQSYEEIKLQPIILLTAPISSKRTILGNHRAGENLLVNSFCENDLMAKIRSLLQMASLPNQDSSENPKLFNVTNQIPTDKSPIFKDKELPPDISKEDLRWLNRLEDVCLSRIGDFHFTVDQLAFEMATSRRQFYRKVKTLTGFTPNEYTKEVRYQQALHLLKSRTHSTVKAVAYSIGLKDTVRFSRHFKKRFGKLPSSFL